MTRKKHLLYLLSQSRRCVPHPRERDQARFPPPLLATRFAPTSFSTFEPLHNLFRREWAHPRLRLKRPGEGVREAHAYQTRRGFKSLAQGSSPLKRTPVQPPSPFGYRQAASAQTARITSAHNPAAARAASPKTAKSSRRREESACARPKRKKATARSASTLV